MATTYALKSVVDQLAIDVAARQTAADVDQRVATALLSYLTQTAYQAGQALQDARLDGHDTEILALQNAGPFATAGDLSNLQVTLQSAIDGILAEIATLGGATNLVNAPAWVGNVTWDLLAGTNQIRNLHATGPLSIQLANDDWTLSFGCDAYTTQQTDDAIAAALTNYFTRAEVTVTVVAAIDESKAYTDTQLVPYSTTVQMNQAISDALLPYGTAAQRDAAISLALQAYYTSAQTDAAIAAGLATIDLSPYYTSAQTDAAIAAAALSNGQSWTGGPTFNLLRGSNVLRNLSVAGALTASLQNLDDTILSESDSYARSETYTQLETGAAITAAIDALDLSQFQNEAEVQALVATALVPYWDQGEVSSFVSGELSNYATSSSVTSAISSALSSYDNSSQVDSKIITALLDFYTQAEVDQAIADATSSSVDLSNYYTQAETQSYVASELLGFYPRTELDSLLTATLTQYWTSSRTQTEIDDAIAGAGFLTQALADQRYFAVSANGSFESLVRTNVTPPQINASLLFRPPLTGGAILGNGSVIEIEADCWSKAQSDGRYPLVATFNSLGSTVTSIDGRVTALENAPGVAPTADLTVNSLTATSFVQTPLLQSAAADLQIRNATTTLRAEDGTLLASFAAGSIGLEQDITVRSDRTLNATTADFAQFFVGSTAATGAFTSSSSITATQQIESDLRVQAPLLRCDPAASVLTVTGGTQGVLVDDTLRVNGVIAPEASLPFLSLSGGSSGVQVLSPLLEQIAVVPNSSVGIVARNAAATGDASLILDSNAQNGLVELKALAGGGVQMNTLFQFMSFNTTNGLANLAIEPNIGGSNNGELIFGYGFVNLSDKALKTNVRDLSEKELQETFDAVEPRMYDRIEGGKDQIGFIAQEVEATPLGERVCKTKNLDGRQLMTLDYQKLNVVLWGVVKSLQKRVEKLEKKKRGRSN